jgi:type 1 glutamine amidotransferase
MRRNLLVFATLAVALAAGTASLAAEPIKALIITGDNMPAHDWKGTTQVLQDFLGSSGRIKVDVTTTPAKDLTDSNLARYDVLILNYRDTKDGPEDTKWSDANKKAFLDAVRGGKGLVIHHFASAAFTTPTNWKEFEQAIAGGWRTQGYHGPKHDPSKPQGTGMDEAVIWVNTFGKGRVFENALGHDTTAMSDKNYQEWMRRGVEWAATGDVSSNGK